MATTPHEYELVNDISSNYGKFYSNAGARNVVAHIVFVLRYSGVYSTHTATYLEMRSTIIIDLFRQCELRKCARETFK